jgi:flagellar hook-associated protein 1 FlgK
MTSFSGLRNAAAALGAASYGMSITGQNIANADTDGYVRERAEMGATGPTADVTRLYTTAHNMTGTVEVTATDRLNDPVVDARARVEHGRSGYYDTKADALSNLETYFDEPSDTGLSEQLNDFWNSWSTVASSPGSDSQSVLLQKANSVTDTLNELSTNLDTLTQSTAESLTNSVTSIQDAANQVGSLNLSIKIGIASGTPVNNLEDQRDVLLTKLADLGGATAKSESDGTVTVSMGGQTLVSESTAATVSLDGAGTGVTIDGNEAVFTGGQAQAQSELLSTTLPGYKSQLDGVASSLISMVNTQHEAGQDASGNAGGAFFNGTDAATISVAITDPTKVAVSAGGGPASLDTSNAQAMSLLGKSTTGPDAAYRTLVGNVGGDSARATQQSTAQDAVTSNVDTLQSSASGVSYDDEVTNLLSYQRAYQASSRVLTTIDQMLDTLINNTGEVGR